VSAEPPAKTTAGLIEKQTLISCELFDPKIPNHNNQHAAHTPGKRWRCGSACAARDQNNQGILSLLIAAANRAHASLKGSRVKPGCRALWWRLLTPET